jgi:hypothetical protein
MENELAILKNHGLMMIYGCSERSAVRTRERVNQLFKRSTGSQITIQDLSIYNGFHPSNIFWSFHYKTRLFLSIKDIVQFLPYRERTAQYYLKHIKDKYHVPPFYPITVFEFAYYFNLDPTHIFALLNTLGTDPENYVLTPNALNKDEFSALNNMEIPKREYYACPEFSTFWNLNEKRFSDPAWNFPKFFALDPLKTIHKPFKI